MRCMPCLPHEYYDGCELLIVLHRGWNGHIMLKHYLPSSYAPPIQWVQRTTAQLHLVRGAVPSLLHTSLWQIYQHVSLSLHSANGNITNQNHTTRYTLLKTKDRKKETSLFIYTSRHIRKWMYTPRGTELLLRVLSRMRLTAPWLGPPLLPTWNIRTP
jgi:hypothetical protein